MDVLDDILETLALRGTLYFRTDFSAPWAVTVPMHAHAARFHFVLKGHCSVEIEGQAALLLEQGDLLLIPRGRSHVIADRTGRESRPLETVLAEAAYRGEGVLALGRHDSEAATHLLCGHFSFRPMASHPLLDQLPVFLKVGAAERARSPWLDELLRMIEARVIAENLGAESTIRRLSEIVFAEVIGAAAIDHHAMIRLVSGLREPQIGRSLQLIHCSPERDWSVASLAAEAGMSRSAFAERFREVVGMTPMAYLGEWRMQKALALLEDKRRSIQETANTVGYTSSAAFSRVFMARFDLTPTDYRRNHER